MRMEISPTSRTEGVLPLWAIRSRADLSNFATGCDKDIGGLSTCALTVEENESATDHVRRKTPGRFYGTITSDLPRGSKIERSGYAAFRNKNRPTLFGSQTWDTTVHPLLALRVRNKFAKPASIAEQASAAAAERKSSEQSQANSKPSSISNPSLRQALHATSVGRSAIEAPAIHALGIGLSEPPGPKIFINIQTDGPVTSDLFQHRLYFDERFGDAWQTIVIPFDDFVLTNTGQVALSQVTMMRERIRTIGISVVLEPPTFHLAPKLAAGRPAGAPSALRKREDGADSAEASAQAEEDWAKDGGFKGSAEAKQPESARRGSRRGTTFNFDLGIEEVFAIGSVEELEAQSMI